MREIKAKVKNSFQGFWRKCLIFSGVRLPFGDISFVCITRFGQIKKNMIFFHCSPSHRPSNGWLKTGGWLKIHEFDINFSNVSKRKSTKIFTLGLIVYRLTLVFRKIYYQNITISTYFKSFCCVSFFFKKNLNSFIWDDIFMLSSRIFT